eukprot:1658874-Amphidinium_carterae.1
MVGSRGLSEFDAATSATPDWLRRDFASLNFACIARPGLDNNGPQDEPLATETTNVGKDVLRWAIFKFWSVTPFRTKSLPVA